MTFVFSIQLINFNPRQCAISEVRSWLVKRPAQMSPVLCSRLIFQDGPWLSEARSAHSLKKSMHTVDSMLVMPKRLQSNAKSVLKNLSFCKYFLGLLVQFLLQKALQGLSGNTHPKNHTHFPMTTSNGMS